MSKLTRSIPSSIAFTFIGLLVVGCGAGTKPTDMSAEEHGRAAEREDELAREHDGHGDVSAVPAGLDGLRGRAESFGEAVYSPTAVHAELTEEHRQLAAAHRAAAAALEHYEEHECGAFPAATRVTCPLLGQVVAVEEIPDGARALFAESVNVDAAAAHIACHLAYAQTVGREGMSECPLYLRDVRSARSGPTTVDFVTSGDVEELRRRLAAHVVRGD